MPCADSPSSAWSKELAPRCNSPATVSRSEQARGLKPALHKTSQASPESRPVGDTRVGQRGVEFAPLSSPFVRETDVEARDFESDPRQPQGRGLKD